jgi:hypothetical protein
MMPVGEMSTEMMLESLVRKVDSLAWDIKLLQTTQNVVVQGMHVLSQRLNAEQKMETLIAEMHDLEKRIYREREMAEDDG